MRAASRVIGSATGAMAAVTAASGLGVGWIAGMTHTTDLVQFTSPPTAIGMTLTYAGKPLLPGFDAVPATRVIALLLLAVVLTGLWQRAAVSTGDPIRAALHGAGLATAATVALAPSFHPWYMAFPLVLLAATTTRTDLVMAAATFAAFLVPPDGSGLARFVKFPGAPLMTVLVVALVVHRLRAAASHRRQARSRHGSPSARPDPARSADGLIRSHPARM